MIIIKGLIEFIFSIALFMNALLFIPQIVKIIREKTAKGVSLTTFLGFLLIQLSIVLHGILINDLLLTLGYIVSMIACGTVVMLILIYNRKNNFENELKAEDILGQIPGHIYWKDKKGRYMGCNKQQVEDLGFKLNSEVIGKTDFELQKNKEDAHFLWNIDQSVIEKSETKILEEPGLTTARSPAVFLSLKTPLKAKNESTIGVIGVSLDITSIRTEQERKEILFQEIIRLMPGTVYWMNREGVYLGCNDNQAKVIGLKSKEDIIGKRNIDIPGFLVPEALDPVNEEVMKTGVAVTLEEPAVLQDGTKATFISSKVPMYNGHGQVIGLVGISLDITDRKNAEEAHIKSEVMADLASSIAHEVRNSLMVITQGVEDISRDLPKLINTYDIMEKTLSEKDRDVSTNDLSNTLKDISFESHSANVFINMMMTNLNEGKIKNTEFKSCSMIKCVDEALNRYSFTTSQKTLLTWKYNKDFIFMGDEELMIHVLFNLIKNALYYVEKARKGGIEIWLNSDENYNRLYFKDTGLGINKEALPHIFSSHYTKTPRGTGMGLRYCSLVMEALGGSIICSSEEGQYAQFVLSFPRIANNVGVE